LKKVDAFGKTFEGVFDAVGDKLNPEAEADFDEVRSARDSPVRAGP
jgi:hypothetical protein